MEKIKLYTEADMIRMYNAGYGTAFTGYGDADIALERFTPIELPSDDLILAQAKDVYSDPTIWAPGEQLIRCAVYEHGAHWVIDQIKQQAKSFAKGSE